MPQNGNTAEDVAPSQAVARDITFEAYRALPGLNSSLLKSMADSPLHFKYAETHPRADTDAMLLGRVTHTAVLEPNELLGRYAIWDGKQRSGAAWKAHVAEAEEAGIEVCRRKDIDKAIKIAQAVYGHPVASNILLSAGEAEGSIQWVDPVTEMLCKCRIDWSAATLTMDLKTTACVAHYAYQAKVFNLDYHLSAAHYSAGVEALTGNRLPFVHIAVEQDAPHDVGVFVLDDDVMDLGRELRWKLMRRVDMCRESGEWPGRSAELQTLQPPKWAHTQR